MKKDYKKVILISIIICLVFSILNIFLTNYIYSNYKKSVNNSLYGIRSILKQNYPNINDEEIMDVLNGKDGMYQEDLKKYGIYEDSPVTYKMEDNFHKHILISILFSLAFTTIFIAFFLMYILRKEKLIKEITNYMKELNQRNYKLDITCNGEGEISILRNEVYKTTVMLREEADALKKEKMLLKDSISDISHQLKTPLTSILIMLDNIIDNPSMEEDVKRDFILDMQKQVENINFLIVNLLKISRFDADVVKFKSEKVNVYNLICDAIENVKKIKSNILINVSCDKSITFKGDYKWEVEAITNILKNAKEHSNNNGTIKIKVLDNAIFTKISIIDEGFGMSKKDLQNIFKRFYKGEDSNRDSIGIGLNLAKKIIEKDNGIISVDSKKNLGTNFSIRYMK